MMTWRLWQRLKRPPVDNPIFRRALGEPGAPIPWYMGCAEFGAFLLIVPVFLMTSFAYSLAWAVGISGAIVKRQNTGVYPLLAITPFGPLETQWALAAAVIYRNNTFHQINAGNTWVGRAIVTGLLFFALVVAPSGSPEPAIVPILLYLMALGALMVIDHVQSIVLGTLIGMMVPAAAQDTVNAPLWAFGAFLAIQLSVYVIAALAASLLFGSGDAMAIRILAKLFVVIALFGGVREVMIRVLWMALMEQLNVGRDEVKRFIDDPIG